MQYRHDMRFPRRDRVSLTSSLAFKVLLPVIGVLIITCAVVFSVYSNRMKQQGLESLQTQIITYTTSKAAELTEPVWNFQDDTISRLMFSYRDNPNLYRISLYDNKNKLLSTESGARSHTFTTLLRNEKELTKEVSGEPLTIGKIVVEFHDGNILTSLTHRRQTDVALALILIIVLGGTTWLVLHLIVGKPLNRLRASLHYNASQRDRRPLVWKSDDELGKVVAAYNALLHEVEHQTETLVAINNTLHKEVSQRKMAETKLAKAHDELEITVNKRTRELRRANKRLMELDQQRSTFLSSASHELRTPLAAILGFSSLIRKNFLRYFMPFADEHAIRSKGEVIISNLEIIGKEGDRLTRLLDDMLDLNKIEAGRMEWRDMLLNLNDEIQRAIKTMESTLKKNPSLRVRVNSSRHLPPLKCDPDRLQQLLLNLLSNAIKHTNEGEITIETASSHGSVFISVIDTGSGIPEDEVNSIFDMFYQGGGGDTDKPTGTGLGLSICKKIAEHYNGTITVDSIFNEGTTFTVELPTNEAP